MRSGNGTTLGSYSTKFSFTTGTGVGILEHDDSNSSLSLNSIYPMPVSSSLNLQLFIREEGELSIEVFDMLDKLVYATSKYMTYGEASTSVSLDKVTPGQYILTLRINDDVISRKIQVMKNIIFLWQPLLAP